MVLKDLRDAYNQYTGKVSDISRQLAFAGIALIWIFKTDNSGQIAIPGELAWPALLFVMCLICDLLHYVLSAIIWGIYNRCKESKIEEDVEFLAPAWINWPGILLFWLKVFVLFVAYWNLFGYLKSIIA